MPLLLAARSTGILSLVATPECRVTVRCDNMDLVADVVQNLALYLNLEDLEVSQPLTLP